MQSQVRRTQWEASSKNPADPFTAADRQQLADSPWQTPCHTDRGMLLLWDWRVNPHTKLGSYHFHEASDGPPSLPIPAPPHPTRGLDTRGTTGTHSFGLGLVGSGPSFPGDGDSFPGVGGESGAAWAGLGRSFIKSACCRGAGGGGGGGVVALGGPGGDGGSAGWPLFTAPLLSSMSSMAEHVCTGGRDDTLGQISSSRRASALG